MLVVEGASPRTLNVTDYGEVVLAERLSSEFGASSTF